MFVPSAESMIRQVFGIDTEDYNRGYEVGYKQARLEMEEFIKRMQAFYTSTTIEAKSNPTGEVSRWRLL